MDAIVAESHDEDADRQAFAATVGDDVLQFAGANEDLLDAAECKGVAIDAGVLVAFDPE